MAQGDRVSVGGSGRIQDKTGVICPVGVVKACAGSQDINGRTKKVERLWVTLKKTQSKNMFMIKLNQMLEH